MKATQSFNSESKFGAIKFFILLKLTFLITTSCDLTDPKKDKPKPEGYQEDIPWPSLADSPWPKNFGTPQNVCRSQENGIDFGKLIWEINSLDLHSGIAITPNNLIVIASDYQLYTFDLEGNEIWKINLGTNTVTTPLITKNEIIVYYQSPSTIYSISFAGQINWKLELDFNINGQFNISKSGEIIFIRNKEGIYSIKNGEILWTFLDNRIGSDFCFSNDGDYLYIEGDASSLHVFDLNSRQITNTIGLYSGFTSPISDSKGNIYFFSVIDGYNGNKPALFSLTPNLEVRWFLPNNEYYTLGKKIIFTTPQLALDKNGNIFFGSDTIYSVSYNGKLNWKYIPESPVGTPYTIDNQQNLYLTIDLGGNFKVIKLSNLGGLIFDSEVFSGESSRFPSVLVNQKLVIPTQDKFLYLLN